MNLNARLDAIEAEIRRRYRRPEWDLTKNESLRAWAMLTRCAHAMGQIDAKELPEYEEHWRWIDGLS